MIPIVSITDLINGIIAGAIAIKLALMYDGNKRDGLLEFIGFYIFFALFWLMFAVPELVFKDAYSNTVTGIIGYVFLFIALSFIVQIPFIFFERRWLGAVFAIFIMALGLTYLVGRIFDPTMDMQEIVTPYVFWSEAYSPRIRVFPGIAGLLAGGTFVATFIYIAWHAAPRWRSEGKTRVYRTAFCLGGGMFLLVAAEIVFFFLSRGGFIVSIITSSLCIAGLLVMLRGVELMHEERKIQAETSIH